MKGTSRIARLLTAFAVAMLATIAPALAATPASAAGPCGNLGHSYLITQSGSLYVSGCQGDQRFGVQTISLQRFDVVQLAGNNIRPRTSITFTIRVPDGSTQTIVTTAADGGGVVRQEPNTYFFTGSAPLGTYQFFSAYTAKTGAVVNSEHVVNVALRF